MCKASCQSYDGNNCSCSNETVMLRDRAETAERRLTELERLIEQAGFLLINAEPSDYSPATWSKSYSEWVEMVGGMGLNC